MNVIWSKMSALTLILDDLLAGVSTTELGQQARKQYIRSAVSQLSIDRPKRYTVELPGDGGMFYLLSGDCMVADFTVPDSSLPLGDTYSKYGVAFTLDHESEIYQIGIPMQRVGVTDGTVRMAIYTGAEPTAEVVKSRNVDIGERNGIPTGITRKITFTLDDPFVLPAGDYFAVLESEDYTYGVGAYIQIAIESSSLTPNLWTYDGTWAESSDEYIPLEIIIGLPGWNSGNGVIEAVEYPAADLSNNETPYPLTSDDYQALETKAGIYLRFINYAPATTENIRLSYRMDYQWIEVNDPETDVPLGLHHAVGNLAAHFACLGLATKYAQNISSTLGADSIDRKSQSSDYRLLAKEYLAAYKSLAQLTKKDGPGIAYADFDASPVTGKDSLFHNR